MFCPMCEKEMKLKEDLKNADSEAAKARIKQRLQEIEAEKAQGKAIARIRKQTLTRNANQQKAAALFAIALSVVFFSCQAG